MSLFRYICRCIPALSLLLWIFIAYQALSHYPIPFMGAHKFWEKPYNWTYLDPWQIIYIIYGVGAHICACILFPSRLIWSIWHMTEEVRAAKYEAAEVTRPYAESEASSMVDDKSSLMSMGTPSLGSATPEGSLSRVSTPRTSKFEEVADSVVHAIILPSYKEDMDTLKETISVLKSHVLAKSSYDLYLAMEARDSEAKSQAELLINEFQDSFHSMSYTLHPGDIEGEVAGKSSNVSWAARQLSHNYVDTESRRNCVITVMDSDTHLSSNYFLLLTKSHREDPNAAITLYCVPIIFDRNAHLVNPFVRAADIFWCGAGLSGLYRGSSVKIPTSVYSIAMTLAETVGGWDTGPESIGEDMHMFLKTYFKTKGQVQTKVIYSPASQSNVYSEVKGIRGIFINIYSRYKQALRHMWGSLDSGYAVQKGIESILRKTEESPAQWLASRPEDRVPRWVKDSNLTHFTPPNMYGESRLDPQQARFSFFNLIALYHRLYEAHFLPAHLTAALLAEVILTSTVGPSSIHPVLLSAFSFCGTLRLIGFFGTGCFIYFYEAYHLVCVRNREEEMKAAGLYENMSDGFSYRSLKNNWFDYCALPVNGTLYGTAPAIVAEFSHFFTDRIVYQVSAKPLKKLAGAFERAVSLA